MAGSTGTRVKPGAASARRPSATSRSATATPLTPARANGRAPGLPANGVTPTAAQRRALASDADAARRAQQIAGIQRARLLAAATRAVDELGYAQATVAHITGRARVSRRTFYEMFANREECLVAVLEDATARIRAELAGAGLDKLDWPARMRGGLWTILCFLDREPALARLCVVQSLRGGSAMLARRERLLAELAAAVDAGRDELARASKPPALTAEGLVGAALGILYNRLLRGGRRPLRSLHGELMALIVLPYQGAAAARREQRRPSPQPASRRPASGDADPLEGVPMRVTYRTARVLEAVADLPGASNRTVSDRAGIHDQGQVSKLLGRLERLGLLVNDTSGGHPKGEPNAWRLTPRGEQVAQSVRPHRVASTRRSGR